MNVKSVLSWVFFLAGALVIAYMIRYIAVTQPRDAAQEQCSREVIAALHDWVDNRKLRDDAADRRVDASVVIIDRLITGQEKTPQELLAWRDAVINEQQIRETHQLVGLPKC